MKQRKKITLSWLSLLAGAMLCSNVIAIPMVDQTGNSLQNGSFESGSTTPITGGGGTVSAATGWRQWQNGQNGAPTSELISDAEMMNEFGLNVIDGDYALRVTALGDSDGLYTFSNFNHPGWNLNDSVTLSAWIYVVSGTMQLAMGSNQDGFSSSQASATGEWQFISVTSAGAQLNNEPLLYSYGGATEFIVDSIWLNNGLLSTHPVQAMNTQVPEPTILFLLLSGLLLVGVSQRRRFVAIDLPAATRS